MHKKTFPGEIQSSARRSGLIGRCVDLIEEFVLDDLRHQAMNRLYGCLAAKNNHSENGD